MDIEKEEKTKKKINLFIQNTIEFIIAIILGLLLNQVLNLFIGFSYVSGTSMYPTLQDKQFAMYETSLIYDDYKQNDIISFKSNFKDSKGHAMNFVKRIIAVGGDTIKIEDNKVYVNGEELDETYLSPEQITDGLIEEVVPEDCYFVLGDNRLNSMDSRDSRVGFIHKDSINGKLLV